MGSKNLSKLVIDDDDDDDDDQKTRNLELMGAPPSFFSTTVGSDSQSSSTSSHSYQGLMYQHNQFNPVMFSSDYGSSAHVFPPLPPLMLDQTCYVQKQSALFQPPCSLMGSLNFFDPNKQIVSGGSSSSSSSSIMMPRWDSSVTRAARSKRRMARQMSTSSSSRLQSICSPSSSSSSSSSASSPSSMSSARSALVSDSNAAQNGVYCFTASDGNRLRFILEKQLKNSDVNTLGRIILPKKPSEANLPSLDVKEGIQVAVKDVNSARTWYMRYRFWPNNKSRMYVMENTGDYVRLNGLKSGDFVMLYHDEEKQLYISCRKAERPTTVPSPEEELKLEEAHQDLTAAPWPLVDRNIEGEMTVAAQPLDHTSMNPSEKIDDHMGNIGDSIFKNYIDNDFSDLENLPDFGDCDLSLYDDLMRSITDSKDNSSGDGDAVVHK